MDKEDDFKALVVELPIKQRILLMRTVFERCLPPGLTLAILAAIIYAPFLRR